MPMTLQEAQGIVESVIAEAGSQDKRIGVAVVNDRDGTVGAVGVSGAAPQQDEELARAAADAFGSRAQQGHGPAPTRQRQGAGLRRRRLSAGRVAMNDSVGVARAALPRVGQGLCPCWPRKRWALSHMSFFIEAGGMLFQPVTRVAESGNSHSACG